MALDRDHPLFRVLRENGIPTSEVRREENTETQDTGTQRFEDIFGGENGVGSTSKDKEQEKVPELKRPQDYDEVLDFIRGRWNFYEDVVPARKNSETVTRSELLNMAMNSGFRGINVSLLGSVIEIRELDIIANKSYEGIGLESIKVDVEEVSNVAKAFLTSKEVSDIDNQIHQYKDIRFVPEVFKIDEQEGYLEVGFNKVFNFKTFCSENNLPDMTVTQPKLVARCHSPNSFGTFTKIEMRTNPLDRVTFESPYITELKTYEDINIPLKDMKEFFETKRDISKTDMVDVSEEDIKNILINRDIGGIV